jgi:hypothetical protein
VGGGGLGVGSLCPYGLRISIGDGLSENLAGRFVNLR